MKTTTAAKGSRLAKSSSTSRNTTSKGSQIAKGSVQELKNESNRYTLALHLEPEDNQRLTNLCGQFDQHLRQIEKHFDTEISNRGFHFNIKGLPHQAQKTINLLVDLYALASTEELAPEKVHLFLQESNHALDDLNPKQLDESATATIRTRKGLIRGRGPNQNFYIRGIQTHDLTFGIGPAGTGKPISRLPVL